MNPAVLDDPVERRRLDPGGMLGSVAGLPEHCREAWVAAQSLELPPHYSGIKQIVDALFSDHRLLQEAALVEVQNGTPKAGQASKAVDYLTNLGFPSDSLVAANAASTSYAATEIIDFTGKTYTTERLADWFGVSKERIRRSTAADAALRTTPAADILVILGQDVNLDSATRR